MLHRDPRRCMNRLIGMFVQLYKNGEYCVDSRYALYVYFVAGR